ncbi:Uridine nucleosidase 1, partial [Schaereria dolodes]|nr:Uridine nucleosidase 1 [Schaereria dolodes]
DAFAIVLAAYHPRLNLLGISTVHGNASLQRTTANAGSVLTAIGRPDVPVYPGAAKPFCRPAVHAPDIHGVTGLDGTHLLPEATAPPITDVHAILGIRDTLLAQPKDTAWLVATGALTNVAMLFATFPELVIHIKGLSIMGGAIGGGFTHAPLGHVKGEGERFGNHTWWAEFNIYCDPEAAQSLLSNPELAAKTTLIPLDVTHQVLATQDVQQRILHGSSKFRKPAALKLRQMLYELLIFFAHTYAEVFGITAGPPLHDPIAVAVLLAGPLSLSDTHQRDLQFDDCGGERWVVTVITDGLHSDTESKRGQVGRTVIREAVIGEGGVFVPRGLDVQQFWSIMEQCVDRASESISSADA